MNLRDYIDENNWGIPGYEKVTRFEIIDHTTGGTGRRVIVSPGDDVAIQVMELQDEGRTLKIRLVDKEGDHE
jgi:hypothetical protein